MNAEVRESYPVVWVGLAGVTLLILVSLALATWDSGTRYQTENIESTLEPSPQQGARFD
jgi:hypothetical protein